MLQKSRYKARTDELFLLIDPELHRYLHFTLYYCKSLYTESTAKLNPWAEVTVEEAISIFSLNNMAVIKCVMDGNFNSLRGYQVN